MTESIFNHLWQSTLFALAVGALTLGFRANRAQVRYWLWFSASIKFMIPMAGLMALGGYIHWTRPAGTTPMPAVSVALVQAAEPFPPPAAWPGGPFRPAPVAPLMPILWTIWLIGFAVIVAIRLRMWRRIQKIQRSGRPFEIPDVTIPTTVDVRAVPGLLEPGVVGWRKPVLLLPLDITAKLSPQQLHAIVMHEMSHIRRRDNLTSTIHMIVEAVFWFHPLVWWIGTRLVDERERACDEEVLQLGNEPITYAEGMLQVCRTYLESPLRSVSGVTGSNLKKRVHVILSGSIAADLNFTKKLLLVLAAACAVALSLVIGMVHASAARQTFEVASVKINKSADRRLAQNAFKAVPAAGRLNITNMTVGTVIRGAYGLQPYEMAPNASSVLNERIDIEAAAGRPVASGSQMQQMLQPLLAERFNLAVHREPREIDAFVLTLARAGRLGTKMKKSDRLCDNLGTASIVFFITPPAPPGEPRACGYTGSGVGRIVGVGLDMPSIISLLSSVGRPIVDQSGLQDRYDIDVTYTPTPFSAGTLSQTGREPMPGVDPNGPSLLNAIEEQLGFKLQPKKMPIPVLVIDHIEPLKEN
jgi:uncharacterized protein (TIGR03435 family)